MRIAITGGIGSGKSYVCRLLERRGIKVYDCDAAAKRLMRTDLQLQQLLTDAVGQDVFPDGKLDKALLSRFIVSAEDNAQVVDNIVHPAVARDFIRSDYEWLESAILFESGFNARVQFNYIVCVCAPLEVRIQRVISRDNITRERALEWINRQIPQEEKAQRSDFVIVNDGMKDINEQIDCLLEDIKKINQLQNQ